MQEHSFLSEFNDDDVIEFVEDNLIKTGKLREAIRNFFCSNIEESLRKYCSESLKIYVPSTTSPNNYKHSYPDQFMGNGVRCKFLKLGSTNWQKGKLKVRVTLEFEPDEPENKEPPSPLDDIRQSINQ